MKRLALLSTTAALLICASSVAAPAQSGRRDAEPQARTAPPAGEPAPQENGGAPGKPDGPTVLCVEKKRASETDALLQQARSEQVFKPSELDERAVIKAKPEPGYTEEARRNNTSGVARLRVLLSATGKVTLVTVLHGLPDGLTQKAIDAACHLKFQPATKGGQPAAQYLVVEYGFRVHHRGPMVFPSARRPR